MPTPVLVDTDIGTDVDDLLALVTLFGDPQLELVGVTTTYGDTVLRARIVKQVCEWAGVDVPIGAGVGLPLSGRAVWVAGHEALQVDGVAAGFAPEPAADVLAGAAREHGTNLVVVAIGPLTNIARALADDDGSIGLQRIAMMGGDFAERPGAEHNVLSDTNAARAVMASNVPIRVVGVDQTRQLRVTRDEIMSLADGAGPLRSFVRRETERWMQFTGEPFLLLHDPLTVAMLVHADAYEFERGTVDVATAGASEGKTSFTPSTSGGIEVVRALDRERLRSWLLQRIADGLEA